jgi:hypothetical protein
MMVDDAYNELDLQECPGCGSTIAEDGEDTHLEECGAYSCDDCWLDHESECEACQALEVESV